MNGVFAEIHLPQSCSSLLRFEQNFRSQSENLAGGRNQKSEESGIAAYHHAFAIGTYDHLFHF